MLTPQPTLLQALQNLSVVALTCSRPVMEEGAGWAARRGGAGSGRRERAAPASDGGCWACWAGAARAGRGGAGSAVVAAAASCRPESAGAWQSGRVNECHKRAEQTTLPQLKSCHPTLQACPYRAGGTPTGWAQHAASCRLGQTGRTPAWAPHTPCTLTGASKGRLVSQKAHSPCAS